MLPSTRSVGTHTRCSTWIGDAIVDINPWRKELALGSHLLHSKNASGGLVTNILALGRVANPFLQQLNNALNLDIGGAVWVWKFAAMGTDGRNKILRAERRCMSTGAPSCQSSVRVSMRTAV